MRHLPHDPRVPGGRLLLAALFLALPGCVPPAWYATEIFAGSWDGRACLVVNLITLGEQRSRFAIYTSEPGDFSRWEIAGHYAGHVRAAAVRDGVVWTFFEDGLYRAYPAAVAGDGQAGHVPEDVRAERLPFEWTPRVACRDSKDALWVVGLTRDGIVTARLAGDGSTVLKSPDAGSSSWRAAFPPEAVEELRRAALDGVEESEGGPLQAPDSDEIPRRARVVLRAFAARDLYVFWHVVPSFGGRANVISGARLRHSNPDPTLPGAWWTRLPDLELPGECRLEDFCVAATGDEMAVAVRLRAPWPRGWMRERMFHARLVSRDGTEEWGPPSAIPGTTETLRFGHIAGVSWVQWGSGGLLLSSNTQRVRVIEYESGSWRPYDPASWPVTYLPEIQVMTLLANALLLVVTGCGVFFARLYRLKSGGAAPGCGAEALRGGLVPAPLLARVFAAAVDVVLVGSLVMTLPWPHDPPPGPLLPPFVQLVRQLLTLAVLAAYGTAMEATTGATLGKMALGLRVVRRPPGERDVGGRSGGALWAPGPGQAAEEVPQAPARGAGVLEPPGFGRALVRNLFRFVETGAVGLAVISVTRARRRFGDLAAGTVVVVAPERPSSVDEGGA